MDCIFCSIAIKEAPAYIVYEDNDFIAFLDIFPVAEGHVQVIPKKHFRWVWDVPNAGEFFEVCKKIANAQKKAFDVEFVQCLIYGEDVEHAHVWLIPLTGEQKASITGRIKFDKELAPELVEKIKNNI